MNNPNVWSNPEILDEVLTKLEQATLSRMAWRRIAHDPAVTDPKESRAMLAWRQNAIETYAETFEDVYMREGIKEYYDKWDYFALAALKRGYARLPAYIPWYSLEGCAGALVLAAHGANTTFSAVYRGVVLGAAAASPPAGLAERFHLAKAQELQEPADEAPLLT